MFIPHYRYSYSSVIHTDYQVLTFLVPLHAVSGASAFDLHLGATVLVLASPFPSPAFGRASHLFFRLSLSSNFLYISPVYLPLNWLFGCEITLCFYQSYVKNRVCLRARSMLLLVLKAFFIMGDACTCIYIKMNSCSN